MTLRNAAAYLLAFTCLTVIAACASNKAQDGPPRSGSVAGRGLPDDPVPRREAKSRYGNGPVYEVLGKRYTVLPSAVGYKERGVASWYGDKFHGNLTSNREVYDMHAMTAAHKTLPLPTYVRVRNLSNGNMIIVRVNDRGPFVSNRIIDLSYSAAKKLDMIGTGTSLVEVEAITFNDQPCALPICSVADASNSCTTGRVCEQYYRADLRADWRFRQSRKRRSTPCVAAQRRHRGRIHTRGHVRKPEPVSRAYGANLQRRTIRSAGRRARQTQYR